MTKTLNSAQKTEPDIEKQLKDQFLGKGLYIKEDDQDWGSAGMNDVQKDTFSS